VIGELRLVEIPLPKKQSGLEPPLCNDLRMALPEDLCEVLDGTVLDGHKLPIAVLPAICQPIVSLSVFGHIVPPQPVNPATAQTGHKKTGPRFRTIRFSEKTAN
jgi:hypothetical protein